jgi:hypothetical protein
LEYKYEKSWIIAIIVILILAPIGSCSAGGSSSKGGRLFISLRQAIMSEE